jgi:hypothetical protein
MYITGAHLGALRSPVHSNSILYKTKIGFWYQYHSHYKIYTFDNMHTDGNGNSHITAHQVSHARGDGNPKSPQVKCSVAISTLGEVDIIWSFYHILFHCQIEQTRSRRVLSSLGSIQHRYGWYHDHQVQHFSIKLYTTVHVVPVNLDWKFLLVFL